MIKKIVLLFILISSVFVLFQCQKQQKNFYFYTDLEKETVQEHKPLIHMMFFPWDKDQCFKEDDLDFNHSPYFRMAKAHPEAHVMMWTHEKTKEFCLRYYPEVWKILEEHSTRPVMYIDILRHLVIYHYGGIYWQYDSVMQSKDLKSYLPSKDKKVKLFTETILTPEFAEKMKKTPIRNGKAEELIRVATQVFSTSEAKSPVIKKLLSYLLLRIQTYEIHCDYDILYVTGNAAMSEFYDIEASHHEEVELVSDTEAKALVDYNAKGRWRTDKPTS